jgi:hypothetical protein
MPTYARGQIVVEDQVGVYHCIARCVRRAFLCGVDPYTGQDFSHRKEWILDRMRELAGLFAIEVCGYSVMSNHLHLVLRNRPDFAERWSDDEIALRWRRICPPRDDTTGEPVEPTDHDLAMLTANPEWLLELRKRLSNLSWFMRCLCEKTGWKRCAASAGCSSRRRGDRACLSDAAARCSRRWFQGKEAARMAFLKAIGSRLRDFDGHRHDAFA